MNGLCRRRRILRSALVAIGIALANVSANAGEDLGVDWYSINGGAGSVSACGDYELRGSLGQAVVGASWGDGYELTAGFWQVRRAPCASDPSRIFCNGFEG